MNDLFDPWVAVDKLNAICMGRSDGSQQTFTSEYEANFKQDLLSETYVDFSNSEGDMWCLLKSEIESIFEQGGCIYIRTKSSDVIQTGFTSIIEAKQMCL